MTVSPSSIRPFSKPKPPSRGRRALVTGSALLGSVSQVPSSLISGLAVGGYHGFHRGRAQNNPEQGLDTKALSRSLALSKALRKVGVSAAMSFTLLPPLAAALNLGKDTLSSGVGLYTFLRSGSAEELSEELKPALETQVPAGHGGWQGLAKGAIAGAKTTLKTGLQVGYQNGRGRGEGLSEGWHELQTQWQAKAKFPQDSPSLLARADATGRALVSAPSAVSQALLGDKSDRTGLLLNLRQLALVGGTGAALGALAGSSSGPWASLWGAGLGAALSLMAPTAKPGFRKTLKQTLDKAQEQDQDLGNQPANFQRDLYQSLITSAALGLRQGWDQSVNKN